MTGARQGQMAHLPLPWELSPAHRVLSGLGPSSALEEAKRATPQC